MSSGCPYSSQGPQVPKCSAGMPKWMQQAHKQQFLVAKISTSASGMTIIAENNIKKPSSQNISREIVLKTQQQKPNKPTNQQATKLAARRPAAAKGASARGDTLRFAVPCNGAGRHGTCAPFCRICRARQAPPLPPAPPNESPK